MSNILQTIAQYSKLRADADKEKLSASQLKDMCIEAGPGNASAFINALKKPGLSFICEIKKASPSKGIISEAFPYTQIASEYEKAGADCISCLTEPKWFLGSDDIFREVRSITSLPMLRKDFIVDSYQIYQARLLGANAVLLICSLMDAKTLESYLMLCHSLGLAAVVEAHDEQEIRTAIAAGAEIIGINNRNLKDFSVNIENSLYLRSIVPSDILFIAESGVKTAEDIKQLEAQKADAVLIGETLMRAADKKAMLDYLKGKNN